jgi:hypothetical protein
MRVFAIMVFLTIAPTVVAEPAKIAVFDIELIDTSQEADRGIRDDQTHRLKLVSDELRKLLQASQQVQLVDTKIKLKEIQQKAPLHKCNGCAEDLAKDLGADLLVSGIVQKTSNLILNFAVMVTDVHSGKVIRSGQVDIRGNTDETWLRGIHWLVKYRLLREPISVPL